MTETDLFRDEFFWPLLTGDRLLVRSPLALTGADAFRQSSLIASLDLIRHQVLSEPYRADFGQDRDGLCQLPVVELQRQADLLVVCHDLLFFSRPEAHKLSPRVRGQIMAELHVLCRRATLPLPTTPQPRSGALGTALCFRHAILQRWFSVVRLDRLPAPSPPTQPAEPALLAVSRPAPDDPQPITARPLLSLLDAHPDEGHSRPVFWALLRNSPLTELFHLPDMCLPDTSESQVAATLAPLCARLAPWLAVPSVAYAICRVYASRGLVSLGSVLSPVLGTLVIAAARRKDRASHHEATHAATQWLRLLASLHAFTHVVAPRPPADSPAPADHSLSHWFAALAQVYPHLCAPEDVRSDPLLRPALEQHIARCVRLTPAHQLSWLAALLTHAALPRTE